MKKILALILALAMILSMAACGKPAEQPPVETQPADPVETQPVETEPVVQEPEKNADRYPLQRTPPASITPRPPLWSRLAVW